MKSGPYPQINYSINSYIIKNIIILLRQKYSSKKTESIAFHSFFIPLSGRKRNKRKILKNRKKCPPTPERTSGQENQAPGTAERPLKPQRNGTLAPGAARGIIRSGGCRRRERSAARRYSDTPGRFARRSG